MSSSTIGKGLGYVSLESVRVNALKTLKEEIGTLETMQETAPEFEAVVSALQVLNEQLDEQPGVDTTKLAWAAIKLARVLALPNSTEQQLTASIENFESEIDTLEDYDRKESMKAFMQFMTDSVSTIHRELRRPSEGAASDCSESESECESWSFVSNMRI